MYNFPPDCNQYTISLLQAVAKLHLEFKDIPPTENETTPKKFLNFWSTAKEKSSSSKSGRDFGHYFASCDDPYLVNFHVRNIKVAVQRGEPLAQWKQGITVLLEKIACNTSINKLCAICLLEADFNWWLKIIFAWCMMHCIQKLGILPVEQGATLGKTTSDSSMLKQLFFDQVNILNHMCAVSSTDAENCYDAGNHSVGSMSP